MNVSGLIEIEYTEATSAAIPIYETVSVSSSVFTGSFLPVDFVKGTGGFTDDVSADGSGNRFHMVTLSFFVPDTTPGNLEELNTLMDGRYVFRVTDPQGVVHVIGTLASPARVVYTAQVDPTHTGRRGYQVTATSKAIAGALLWTDETPSS